MLPPTRSLVCLWAAALMVVPADAGHFHRVNPAAPSSPHDGHDWPHAFLDLQDALDDPNTVQTDEIWVAAATYKPSVPYPGAGAREKTFHMRNEV